LVWFYTPINIVNDPEECEIMFFLFYPTNVDDISQYGKFDMNRFDVLCDDTISLRNMDEEQARKIFNYLSTCKMRRRLKKPNEVIFTDQVEMNFMFRTKHKTNAIYLGKGDFNYVSSGLIKLDILQAEEVKKRILEIILTSN
jgi:hypothetical protein